MCEAVRVRVTNTLHLPKLVEPPQKPCDTLGACPCLPHWRSLGKGLEF